MSGQCNHSDSGSLFFNKGIGAASQDHLKGEADTESSAEDRWDPDDDGEYQDEHFQRDHIRC